MKKTLLFSTLLLMLLALLMTGAAAETVTYTGSEATTVGATFNVKHDCGNPNAVCTVTVAATCSSNGAGNGFCDECGAKYANFTVTIAANESFHTWSDWSTTVPTCTKDGYKTRYCTNRCGASEKETIAATGHPGSRYVIGQAATCTEEGLGVYQCIRCGTTMKTEVLPATGHSWGEWVMEKIPTCISDGLESRTCTKCGERDEIDHPMMGEDGHGWDNWESEEATCTEEGFLAATCQYCGWRKVIVDQKLGHIEKSETVKEPTCTQDGTTVVKCTRCNTTLSTTPIPASGHKYGEWKMIQAPTCVANGQEGQTCSACGNINSRRLPAAGHSWGEWVVVEEPNCLCGGARRSTCQGCGAPRGESIDPIPHDWEPEFYQEATCTRIGEGYMWCSFCGRQGQLVATDALGHDWGEWKVVQERTCVQGQMQRRDCKRCGEYELYEDGITSPHTWGNEKILEEPTCASLGSKTMTCEVCGEVRTFDVNRTRHSKYVEVQDTAPTCTEQGGSHYECPDCGERGISVILSALGHNLVTVPAVPATETEPGWTYGIGCDRCGYWEKQPHPITLIDVTAGETLSLASENAGTIFDYEGNVVGVDAGLLEFITSIMAQNEDTEILTYVTVYRDANGDIVGYVDSNGDLYVGWGTSFELAFNIYETME